MYIIFRFRKLHIRIATLAIKSKYFIIPEINDKMHKIVYLDYNNKVCNMQLTYLVGCHIMIEERSPLTLWS